MVDLSIRSITKGIEDGTIQHPHLLLPNLREQVMEEAIKQGLANHPNCLRLLTSVEFLNGLTSISAKACSDNDLEFLKRLVASLSSKLPNGQTVGAGFTKLNLKIFEHDDIVRTGYKNEKTYWGIISKLSDLIGQCPNTTSMILHLTKEYAMRGYLPFNENKNSACNRVMENLIELSVVSCNWKCLFGRELPFINFKKLTTLKLEHCCIDNGSWPKLLEKIPFVENLHLLHVTLNGKGLDCILRFPLPHLKSLKVLGCGDFFECNKPFVDNLMECKQLRQVHLMLDEKSIDEESVTRLANMDIDLKLKIRIFLRGNDAAEDAAIFDSFSRFKLVRIFHEKTASFKLEVWQKWNAQYSTALEDVVNICSNLTSLDLVQQRFRLPQPQVEFEETKRFNATLVRFFNNSERTQKLKGLRLIGNIDETVLSAVFDSCLNLVRLIIRECPQLRDQHLIDWVARGGGKLIDLTVEKCNNVTSEGIIPILAKSAEGLLRFNCSGLGQENVGRNLEPVLRNHCPNAVIGEFLLSPL